MRTAALKSLRSVPVSPVEPVAVKPVEAVEPVSVPVTEIPVSKPVNTAFTPANDPFLELVSGPAPDPSTEIPLEAEPAFAVPTGEEETPRRFKTLSLQSASNDNGGKRYIEIDNDTGVPTSINQMEEAEFIEFWAIDIWETIADISSFPILQMDLDELRTEEDDFDRARSSARHLYRLALKYPKWLGWMISEATVDGSDVLMAAAFFGGKAFIVLNVVKEKLAARKEKKTKQLNTGTSGNKKRSDRSKTANEAEAAHAN